MQSECESRRRGLQRDAAWLPPAVGQRVHGRPEKPSFVFSCCEQPSACVQLMLDAVAETAEVARFWPLFWPLCLRNRVRAARGLGDGFCWRPSSGDKVVWSYATCSFGRTPASCRAAITTHYSARGYSTSSRRLLEAARAYCR